MTKKKILVFALGAVVLLSFNNVRDKKNHIEIETSDIQLVQSLELEEEIREEQESFLVPSRGAAKRIKNIETGKEDAILVRDIPIVEEKEVVEEPKPEPEPEPKPEPKVEKPSKDYYIVNARISAYSPYDNQSGICNDGDINTSTGVPARRELVAVAPTLIPYGTKMEIEGFPGEVFEAGDTGGTMRNKAAEGIYAIDVFFDTYKDAMAFGIQWREVKIYK